MIALAAGILTLFLWLARRSDRVMLWFSIACLFWGTVGLAYTKLRWEGVDQISSVLYFTVSYGLVVPTMILSLRTVDLKWPKFEAALWLFFLFELSYPLWPGKPWPGALLAWDGTNMALLLGAVGIVLYAAPRPLHWPIRLQLAALTAMAVFMGYEIARFLGWAPVESPVMRHYHVPVMLLAMGAACFERHARAIRRTESMNLELERRIEEKTHEIEANHARIDESLRERALVDERQRILSDMHDGLGATLVSLLRHVRAGNADPASVRRRAHEALQEMRAAIDALQPHGGDLGAVLGALRPRLHSLIAASGLRLAWRVDELPSIGELAPSAVFALQRIVLEAVGNALKHSEATEVRFVARTRDDGNIEIRIDDNGRGFDPAQPHTGRGLGNMRARAARIGAALDIISQPGKGTAVQLLLPRSTSSAADNRTGDVPAAAAGLAPSTRTAIVAAAVAISLALATGGHPAEAAAAPRVFEFGEAAFLPSSAPRPPDQTASWSRVILPDEWHRRPGSSGAGWYRMKFELERAPSGLQAIVLHHRRAYDVAFFVNGKLVGTARDNQSMTGSRLGGGLGTPIRHNVLANMLRAGENVIHVRLEGSDHPALLHGLGRVYFGDARPVRRVYNRFNEAGFSAKREFMFMMLAAGMIALFIWLARQRDRVMFWFSITCLSWGALGIAYLMWRWSDWTMVSSLLYFYTIYGLVVPTVILSLRTVDMAWPRFEAALWVFFAIELSYPLWGEHWPAMHFVWNTANFGLLVGAVGIVLSHAPRPLRWPMKLQAAALATMAVVMSAEIARYLGLIDVESPEIRHFHVPLMLVAMGALCFDRYTRAIREAEHATLGLGRRVAEKTREIEANHARAAEALHERTLAGERQRVLADMHEGLGANLVSLIMHIDSGQAGMAAIERRVQGALQEMRVAIDALQAHGGDLAAVLGALRERIDGLTAGSGTRLDWQVDELPLVPELTPAAIFSLQRIVLDAVANTLEHAGATRIRFSARAIGEGDIEIAVEDDGRGFDAAKERLGPGLTNMRARAERLGARLTIDTRAGGGTTIRLVIPSAATARTGDPATNRNAPPRPTPRTA